MDWLDLLAVQGTLRSLLQCHSSKASVLWHPAFFTVQLSHPYMTTGKTTALTRRTFVGKERLCFLICCLDWSYFSSKEQTSFNFMAAITICSDFGAPKNKVSHCFHCFPIYLPCSVGSFKPAFSLSFWHFSWSKKVPPIGRQYGYCLLCRVALS